jgi:hypothetical protein
MEFDPADLPDLPPGLMAVIGSLKDGAAEASRGRAIASVSRDILIAMIGRSREYGNIPYPSESHAITSVDREAELKRYYDGLVTEAVMAATLLVDRAEAMADEAAAKLSAKTKAASAAAAAREGH